MTAPTLITREFLDEIAVLNGLTDAGLISDLCVTAKDVASKDCFRACQWVLLNKKRFVMENQDVFES